MRLKIRLLSFFIILLLLTEFFFVSYSSFVDLTDKWRTIKIKKGNHSYYPSVRFIYKLEELEFYFKPNETWYYKKPERNGWSKIRGFSKGLHKEGGSARLVYKCIDDTLLVVGSYCYVNGVSPNESKDQQAILDTIFPGNTYHCRIEHIDKKFRFSFEDKYWECDAGENPNWGYILNPFIGGVYTLDHGWTIDIFDFAE